MPTVRHISIPALELRVFAQVPYLRNHLENLVNAAGKQWLDNCEKIGAAINERDRLIAKCAELQEAADCMFEILTMLRYQLTDGGWIDRHGHVIEMNKVFIDVCISLDAAKTKATK